MSIFDHIVSPPLAAPRVTIFGKASIGKSTLASQFPDPLFLLTEFNDVAGINCIPNTFGKIRKDGSYPLVFESYTTIYDTLMEMIKSEVLPFKTLVIDSISKLDSIICDEVIKNSPDIKGKKAETLTQAFGGYGAGFQKAAIYHRTLKRIFDMFKQRGIAVVFVAHIGVAKHKSPETEDYDIHSIIMNHEQSRAVYVDDVDAVLYCKQKSFISETESGRTLIKSTSDRVIITEISDAHVSKTRFTMPGEIPLSFDELKKYIPFFNQDEVQK